MSSRVLTPLVANESPHRRPGWGGEKVPQPLLPARYPTGSAEFIIRILITGGCGYIGSALKPHLANQGHTVHTVDILHCPTVQADYRDLASSFYAQYSLIIHLAGHSSVAQCKQAPREAILNNLSGLIDLTGKLNGQPLLWASSSSVLSSEGGNVYDQTKRIAEELLPELYPNAAALRFGTVCGVSPNMRWDLMLNKMVRDAITDEKVYMTNPQISRPILAIRDLCGAIEALTRSFHAGRYNLASFNSTVQVMADTVAKMVPAEVVRLPGVASYDFVMAGQNVGDWQPSQRLADIIADLDATRAVYA